MDELSQLHCSAVTASTPRLDEQEITQLMASLPGWRTYESGSGPRLEKVFTFKDFREAVDFTDRVARAADEEDHHPALLTEWGKVTVTWWTHRIQGLHKNDFIMAAKTEQLYGGGNER